MRGEGLELNRSLINELAVFTVLVGSAVLLCGCSGYWRNPITNVQRLNSAVVEATPFVFNDRLYLLENWQKQFEYTGLAEGSLFEQDEVRVRDVKGDVIISTALTGHGLGTALVNEGKVYVFAGYWGTERKWKIKRIDMTISADLKRWTEPQTVLEAEANEHFFNVAVCRGRDNFVMLVETDDRAYQPPFTFKYFTSDDLIRWQQVPNAIYGRNKYVGGPALYYFCPYYYTLYLEALGGGRYETRIARSKDLVEWDDAPEERAFVSFNPENRIDMPGRTLIRERNASDAELTYFEGKTVIYFTGGDQILCGDLKRAQFNGSARELLEHFFK